MNFCLIRHLEASQGEPCGPGGGSVSRVVRTAGEVERGGAGVGCRAVWGGRRGGQWHGATRGACWLEEIGWRIVFLVVPEPWTSSESSGGASNCGAKVTPASFVPLVCRHGRRCTSTQSSEPSAERAENNTKYYFGCSLHRVTDGTATTRRNRRA